MSRVLIDCTKSGVRMWNKLSETHVPVSATLIYSIFLKSSSRTAPSALLPTPLKKRLFFGGGADLTLV